MMDLNSQVCSLISKHGLTSCVATGGSKDWSRVSVSDSDHLPLAHGIVQRVQDQQDENQNGLLLQMVTAHGKPIYSENLQDEQIPIEILIRFLKRVDSFRLCEGIETDLSVFPTRPRLSLSELASRYILEPWKGTTVLRSRNCVYDANQSEPDGTSGGIRMENDMDEAGICCHECRTTRQKLANYTSGGDEAAAAAAAGSNDTPDLSAFLEESMEVDEGEALMYGDEDNVDQEQINLEHQEQEQAIVAGNYQATYFNAPPDNDTNDQQDQSTPLVQITSVRSLSGVGPGIEALQNGGASSRECHICQKVFSHGLKLCAHLTGDYVTNNKQLFCSICSTKWDTLSQFNVHVASVHLKAKPYMCKNCNFATSRRAFLASHLESSHKVKGDAINDHININQEEMAKVEDLRSCKGDLSKLTVPIVANASAAINLNGGGKLGGTPSLQPQQGLTPPSSTATSATSAGTSSPSKPYKCAHCDYTTANKLTIYEHCAKKHSVKASVNDIQVVGKEPQWKCFVCSLECASFFSLLYHHMRHLKLKPFLCKHCNFANVKKGNLYDHCENIHRIKGGSDEDMIEIDQDQYAQMEALKELLRNGQEYDRSLATEYAFKKVRVDRNGGGGGVSSAGEDSPKLYTEGTGVKRYKCIHCDFATSRRNGIYSHCEHKHGIKGSVKDVQLLQPEPKHVCSECSSSCVTFAGFLYHHMSHLNIKPFHCRFCTYTSNKKTNLTTHLERVHDSKTVEADIVIEEEEMRRMGRLREKLAANPKGIFSMDDKGNISLVSTGPETQSDASSQDSKPLVMKQIPKKENLAVPMVSSSVSLTSVSSPGVLSGSPGASLIKKTDNSSNSHPNANKEYSLDTFLDFVPDDGDGTAGEDECDEQGESNTTTDADSSISGIRESLVDSVTVMGSKPYRCRHCDFTTNKKNSVFAHCEVRHGFKGSLEDVEIIGKENKFECKVCNMGFVTLPRYVSHVTTHLKIKPFRCAHCDYGSNKKLNVQQHCERIHVQFEEIIVNESEMAKLNELKDIMAREAMKIDPELVNPFRTPSNSSPQVSRSSLNGGVSAGATLHPINNGTPSPSPTATSNGLIIRNALTSSSISNGNSSGNESPPRLQVKTESLLLNTNSSLVVLPRKQAVQQHQQLHQRQLPPPPPLIKAVTTSKATVTPVGPGSGRRGKRGGGGNKSGMNADALDTPFQCSNCEHVSDTRSGALQHCQQHHDIYPSLDPDSCPLVPRMVNGYYQCAKCGEEFKFRQTLLRHLMGHMEITPYLCAHCSHASRFKSCVRKHAAKMHNTAGNDADVITDDIEETKVKMLTNKLRIFYTLSGSGSGMFPGDRGLEIETQEEYDEEFHQAVPDPPSAAATLNHQAVILNSHHSLASLLAAAAAAQQQLAPAASTDDQELQVVDGRHVGTVDEDDEEYEEVIEMEEEEDDEEMA